MVCWSLSFPKCPHLAYTMLLQIFLSLIWPHLWGEYIIWGYMVTVNEINQNVMRSLGKFHICCHLPCTCWYCQIERAEGEDRAFPQGWPEGCTLTQSTWQQLPVCRSLCQILKHELWFPFLVLSWLVHWFGFFFLLHHCCPARKLSPLIINWQILFGLRMSLDSQMKEKG